MKIETGLLRQKQAMMVLLTLLEEEFSALAGNAAGDVASLEFSIQELIRQLMDEKGAVKSMLEQNSFSSLEGYIDSLKKGEARVIREILKDLEGLEEQCSFQAMKNNAMASALADQTAGLVKFLYHQVTPREENVYGAGGRWYDNGSKSTGLLRGTL